jgi:hypothetical protein
LRLRQGVHFRLSSLPEAAHLPGGFRGEILPMVHAVDSGLYVQSSMMEGWWGHLSPFKDCRKSPHQGHPFLEGPTSSDRALHLEVSILQGLMAGALYPDPNLLVGKAVRPLVALVQAPRVPGPLRVALCRQACRKRVVHTRAGTWPCTLILRVLSSFPQGERRQSVLHDTDFCRMEGEASFPGGTP